MVLRQMEILHEIAGMALEASHGDFDELVLEVTVDVEGGHTSAQCRQTIDGKVESLSLWEVDAGMKLMNLSFELHEEIKNHTGGDMSKHITTVDENGRARTVIEYRNIPPARASDSGSTET